MEFFNTYLENVVRPALSQYQATTVDDAALRKVFLSQIKAILTHYQFHNQQVGNLPIYMDAIERGDEFLKRHGESLVGYLSLLPIAAEYIKEKVLGREVIISGELGDIIAAAKKNNAIEKNGCKPLLQITSDAERDFVLLIIEYLHFFIVSRNENRIKFTSKTINVGLALPGVDTVVGNRIKKFEIRLNEYTQHQGGLIQDIEAKLMDKKPDIDLVPPCEKQKLMLASYNVINCYISQQPRFNWYGKRRANEFKQEIENCVNAEAVKNVIDNFIKTGKTKSDYKLCSIFRSITRSSGNNPASLRTKMLQARVTHS